MRQIFRILVKEFARSEKKLRAAKLLLELGLRINEKKDIMLNDVRIPYSSIARAIGTDRRTVKDTIETILNKKDLRDIFLNMLPAGPFLKDVAKIIGQRILTIEVHYDRPGIIAHVSNVLAKNHINILQIIAEYPDLFENPKLYIIVEGNLPGEIINEIMKYEAIKSVKID